MKRTSFLFCAAAIISALSCLSAQAQVPSGQPKPAMPPPVQIPPAQVSPAPQVDFDKFIAFDALEKDVKVTNGTPQGNFTFNLTNISSVDVTINFVQTSCGCTVAKLPSQPWKIAPKESGQISATMNLAGTPAGGTKTKTLTVNSDKGNKMLIVKTTVLAPPPSMSEMDRTNNQKIAMADRQAVFKGDCVKCHVAPAKDSAGNDKTGRELYAAVCGVCHDAQHQASFVPNLHRLPEPTNIEFWKNWIAHGKPGTLMPAFAKSEGGVLTDAQIDSLVVYLTATIPPKPTAQNGIPTLKMIQ